MTYIYTPDGKLLYQTHTHTRLTALCPGLPRWAGTRKVKPISVLLEQETVSGSGISWAICKSAPCSRQITTSVPHYSSFLRAGCPSCRPTNSVKALKTQVIVSNCILIHNGFKIQVICSLINVKKPLICWQCCSLFMRLLWFLVLLVVTDSICLGWVFYANLFLSLVLAINFCLWFTAVDWARCL